MKAIEFARLVELKGLESVIVDYVDCIEDNMTLDSAVMKVQEELRNIEDFVGILLEAEND